MVVYQSEFSYGLRPVVRHIIDYVKRSTGMPKGPRGEDRPIDPVAAAIMSLRVGTRTITESEAKAEIASARAPRTRRATAGIADETKR